MSQEHIKEPAYWPEQYRGSGNQVTQNMPKKYTILAEIKVLQDRLQDMYTNRSDMVNITGDGWAAAHQNEIKEIFWVYLKALGWISGFHGAIIGVIIGIIGGIVAGVTFEASLYQVSIMMFMLSAMFVLAPFGYMLYAEIITEDSAKFVVGQNTEMFFGEMRKSMQFIVANTWIITFATFVAMLFILGLFEEKAVAFSMGMLKIFGLVIPERLGAAIYNNGSIYGISWFAIMLASAYIARIVYIDRVKTEAQAKSNSNKKTQNRYKHKDAVQEVREIFD